ncbi:hypothetical protein A2U01_0070136, partial [Trifolium medium]|nr:hypothetical protein [Trifolium medium]
MNIDKLREWAFGHNTVTNTHNHSSSNAYAASIHPYLLGGLLSHSPEPTSQTINVVATNGDEFGDGNNNKKKKK